MKIKNSTDFHFHAHVYEEALHTEICFCFTKNVGVSGKNENKTANRAVKTIAAIGVTL